MGVQIKVKIIIIILIIITFIVIIIQIKIILNIKIIIVIINERGSKRQSLVVAFPSWSLLLHARWTLAMEEIVIGIIKADCYPKNQLSWLFSIFVIINLVYYMLAGHLQWQKQPSLSLPEKIDHIFENVAGDHDDDIFTGGLPTAHCLQLRRPPSVTTLLFNFKMDTTPCKGRGYYLPTPKQPKT